jgi:hypothetical protein
MPLPSTIVTFTDADGDEFPVRVPGLGGERFQETVDKAARLILDDFVDSGDYKPTLPVSITDREEWT